jgi:pathogenesis-related protein 1
MVSTILQVVLAYLALDVPTNDLSRDTLAPSPADKKAYLDAHNTIRSQHGALPLVWNQTLSDKGASWAARCVFKHSGGSLGPYGENLAAGTGQTAAQAVKLWTDEKSTSL